MFIVSEKGELFKFRERVGGQDDDEEQECDETQKKPDDEEQECEKTQNKTDYLTEKVDFLSGQFVVDVQKGPLSCLTAQTNGGSLYAWYVSLELVVAS